MPGPSPGVANQFLPLARVAGHAVTNMHLQKLVYIAHGWNLAIRNEPLTNDDPEAWDYGPVYPDLYRSLSRYGSNNVNDAIKYVDYMPYPDVNQEVIADLNQEERDIINAVWHSYGRFHAFQLSALTHVESSPWTIAYAQGRNTIIGPNEIRDFFLRVARERGREAEPAFA